MHTRLGFSSTETMLSKMSVPSDILALSYSEALQKVCVLSTQLTRRLQ